MPNMLAKYDIIPELHDGSSREQIANILWIIEKAKESKRNIYSCFIDYVKASDGVDQNKLESP